MPRPRPRPRPRSRAPHRIDFIAVHTREERRRSGTLADAMVVGMIAAVLYVAAHIGAPEVFGGLTLFGVLAFAAKQAGKFYGGANAPSGDSEE